MQVNATTFLIPVLILTSVLPNMLAAQTPEASPAASLVVAIGDWRIASTRELDVEGEIVSLSPDGQWLARTGPDGGLCVWNVETLEPRCTGENLPVYADPFFPAWLAWSPDSSAVAFSLDAIRQGPDSDIYVYELEDSTLTNLTDDGYEGSIVEEPVAVPVDVLPTWSPDGRQLAFVRSTLSDEASSTAIMRVDRAGGEPGKVYTLGTREPLAIWMPMYWLPDDTILFAQRSADREHSDSGVWRVGLDGSNPTQLVTDSIEAGIPGASIMDVSGKHGIASVFSPLLLTQFFTAQEQVLYWTVDLADGTPSPVPYIDLETKQTIPATEATTAPGASIAFPTGPLAFSPDGSVAVLLYRSPDASTYVAMLHRGSSEVVLLARLQTDVDLSLATPQWAANDTILLHSLSGTMLITLERVD